MKVSLASFEKIVEQNEDRLLSAIYGYVGDYEDALDLTQETFIRAYRSLDSFRGKSSISTWLYRIGINLAKKHLSKKNRWGRLIVSSTEALTSSTLENARIEHSTEERLIHKERAEAVQRQILELPPKYRAVVGLKYQQELSYEEIAEVLKIRVGTVKSRLSRAKQLLEERLRE